MPGGNEQNAPAEPRIIDIGGEGRHPQAWNVNPSPVRTLGPRKGMPIERHIAGRAAELPFADNSIQTIIVERTPLPREALLEIARVVAQGGSIVLRLAPLPWFDPLALAKQILPGDWTERTGSIDGQPIVEARFRT